MLIDTNSSRGLEGRPNVSPLLESARRALGTMENREVSLQETRRALQGSVEKRREIATSMLHGDPQIEQQYLGDVNALSEELRVRSEVMEWRSTSDDVLNGTRTLNSDGTITETPPAQVAEKRSLWSKTMRVIGWPFRKVGELIKNHPIKAAIILSLVTVIGGFWLSGNWELFLTKVGLDKWKAGADATKQLVNPVAPTPILPGGGEGSGVLRPRNPTGSGYTPPVADFPN